MSLRESQIKESVASHQADLDAERAEREARKKRDKARRGFNALPQNTLTEFWCVSCQMDFVAPSYKFWSEVHQCGSWHSFCPGCERPVCRYIDAKKFDPYYEQSLKVRIMRSEAEKDMLTPFDYGYQTLYGDPFEHYYKRFQQSQDDIHNRYAALGLVGKTMGQKIDEEALFDSF